MKRILSRLVIVLLLIALLIGTCYMLCPHSFADLQPECDSIMVYHIDTTVDSTSQSVTKEIYSSESAEFKQIMDILSRYTYHRSFRTLAGINVMEGNHAGYWIMVYLYHGDDLVDFTCGGTGEITIDDHVWRIGYWGDRVSIAMMSELAAVLNK